MIEYESQLDVVYMMLSAELYDLPKLTRLVPVCIAKSSCVKYF